MNREQDNGDSSTTQEAVLDDGCRREQQQTPETVVDNEHGREQEDLEAVIVIEVKENKDNEKQKENNDIPALNTEQHNEDSTTTQESAVDNGHG